MKKFLTLVLLLFSLVSFSQTVEYTEDDLGYLHYTMYYDNGNVKEEGQYYNNKKTGTWYEYNRNGKLRAVAHFTNDKREGKWKFYDLDSNMITYVYYDNNKMTKAIQIKEF